LKTNRAAAKRFRKTANGWKSYSAGRRHNLGHKPRKIKRQLRSGGSSLVHKSDKRPRRPAFAELQVVRSPN
jgi:large subunit ribosomal protein L35